ncbi:thylakoid lumenal 15.0 kDa protein 2, chloroplastic isoform X2 [Cryptomeria japonica]|uniref:thylakoid lumenal 15.0 kDa protein 2, chloroplastic isoform X2 n=1 Tax=Cryptomeria japonica TaxID=3369 RepID=UPI0027DA137D|nr:thylakoid lumenal 15.0 kDa protein 2, chloroplastic isoform X2 [Cryptomeria japonica]
MGLQAIHLTAVSPLVVSPPSKNFKQAKGWAMPSSTLFLQNPGKQKYNIAIRAKLSNGMANWVQVNRSVLANAVVVGALSLSISICGLGKATAKEGVNKPEMLPKEFTPLIDVAGYLSPSQESRMIEAIYNLEKDTGFKLRVLAQNYPETPGNILNFNVGASVDLDIPRSFWSRLAGKYGNIFYWRENGEDASIEAAVSAINSCLREPLGPNACSEIK